MTALVTEVVTSKQVSAQLVRVDTSVLVVICVVGSGVVVYTDVSVIMDTCGAGEVSFSTLVTEVNSCCGVFGEGVAKFDNVV